MPYRGIGGKIPAMRWKKWNELDAGGKTFRTLLAIAVFGFLLLAPLFLLHDEKGSYGVYPLGWLLGSVAELLGFLSMKAMVSSLGKDGKGVLSVYLGASLRFVLFAAVLLVSAICTFRPDWFGGFDAFSFYTCFAAILPFPIVTWLMHYLEGRGGKIFRKNPASEAPEKKDEPSSEVKE